MARSTTVYSVALCSPGGLEGAREAVRGAADEVNRFLVGDGVQIEILGWELDVRPTMGSDAQDVVNQQIIDNADIGVVIIADTLGSPTPRAPSGTVEEARSFIRRRKAGDAVDLMVFFKRVLSRYDRSHLERMVKVVEFREELAADGVFWKEFENDRDLADLVRLHLPSAVRELRGGRKSNLLTDAGVEVTTVDASILSLDLVDAEDGAIDSEIAFSDSMDAINDANAAMGEAAERLAAALSVGTQGLNALQGGGRDPRAVKAIIDKMSESMCDYASELRGGYETLKSNSDVAIQSTIMMIGFAGNEVSSSAEEMVSLAGTIDTTKSAMEELALSIDGSVGEIARMPRMTKQLNAAKREVILRTEEIRDVIAAFSERLGEAANAARDRAAQLGQS